MTSPGDLLPGVPLVHSPFFAEILAGSDWDNETRRVAADLHRDGFAVLDFQEPDLDLLAADIIQTVHPDLPWEKWRSGEIDELPRNSDAWRTNNSVRRIAANSHVVSLLSRIYGRDAFPFQTLNFPIGSQQATHIDLVHFASAPADYMCGVWLALEDIEEGAGPLQYYPGSHRWPVFYNDQVGCPAAAPDSAYDGYPRFDAVWRRMADVYSAEIVQFHPRKGQALIWAAGLHHGGAPHTNRAHTRHSQVTHYFFRDCAYYTPLLSEPFAGRVGFRRQLQDIRTGEVVANTINGVAIPEVFLQLSTPLMTAEVGEGRTMYPPAPVQRSILRRVLERLPIRRATSPP